MGRRYGIFKGLLVGIRRPLNSPGMNIGLWKPSISTTGFELGDPTDPVDSKHRLGQAPAPGLAHRDRSRGDAEQKGSLARMVATGWRRRTSMRVATVKGLVSAARLAAPRRLLDPAHHVG